MTKLKLFISLLIILLFSNFLSKAQTELLPTEEFNSAIIYTGFCQEPCNYWISISSTSPVQWFANGGCSGGYAGYAGSWNNFYSTSLRTPVVYCQGNQNVTLKLNISNSYEASHTKSYFSFSMWDNSTQSYHNPDSIKINKNKATKITTINFDKIRNCDTVLVYFTMSTYPNNTSAYFYMSADCYYNDSNDFSYTFDNVSVTGGINTGIAQTEKNNEITILQKNHDVIAIITKGAEQHSVISIYSIDGRLQKQTESEGNAVKEISVSGLSSGIYLLKYSTKNNEIVKKIILQ